MAEQLPNQKQGLSPLAWVGIGCAGLVVVGFIGASIFIGWGAKKVSEMVEDAEGNPGMAVAEMMIKMNPETEFIDSDPATGLITFRDANGEEMSLNFEDIQEGRFSITTEEGEMVFNADGNEEGGSFTVTGPDGEVVFDAQGSGEDGTLTITGPDGEAVIKAEGDGEDGSLVITGPDGETRFGAGASAEDVPNWVPSYPGASASESNYSATTAEGRAGALTSTTTDSVDKVKSYFEDLLKREGYEVSTQAMNLASGEEQAAVIATKDGNARSVNVVIARKDSETTVIVNYNAKNP